MPIIYNKISHLYQYLKPFLIQHGMMRIILFLIIVSSTSCYSTAGWAEEFIMTKDSNVVESSESDNGIVICKWRGNHYYVTNITRNSYSFYPNYILGKCTKGLFAFNETTYEVKYFNNYEELKCFKKDNDLGFSYKEKRQFLFFSIIIPFFALVIVFFILTIRKNNLDLIELKKFHLKAYLIIYFLEKLLNLVIGYIFILNPDEPFAPNNLSSILLYSVCFVSPWLILFLDYKKANDVNKLLGNSILYVFFLLLDFGIIMFSYNLSGLFGNYIIFFILFCNVILIVFYWLVVSASSFIRKKINIGDSMLLGLY